MHAKHRKVATRTSVVVTSVAVVAVLGSGVAFAYWSVSGSGDGTASAGSATPLTVSATASISGLYPTATGVAGGVVNVTNPNPFKVSLTPAPIFGSASTTKAGCTGSVVTFAVAAGAPTVINAGQTVQVPFTASMSNAAEDACQNATFTSTLQVSGQSAA